MPSGYAHLRFGNQTLPKLPEQVRMLAQQYPHLYEVGLQGPDLFFYYDPVFRSGMGALGHEFHMRSGKEFFGGAAELLRQAPSDAGRAYLFGVLGHYCLDSMCHPYVRAVAAGEEIGHTEMETEFDRFLMARDGITEPHRYGIRDHYRLTGEECSQAAAFYPPANGKTIKHCLKQMRWIDRLSTMGSRRLQRMLMGIGGKEGLQFIMAEELNEHCVGTTAALFNLYDQAAERMPEMAEQLLRALDAGEALDRVFDATFG